MSERWLPIAEDPRYEVSDRGRVRSWTRRGNWARIKPRDEPLMLKLTPTHDDYRVVKLGANRQRKVHHLVLDTFVGSRPPGTMCCHGNGVRSDNRLENLRWGTGVENCADEVLHGTTNRGEAHSNVKLTNEKVLAIRASSLPGVDLADIYGVTSATISHIQRRKTWRHI